MVRLEVRVTGCFMSPVMLETASTPESASMIATRLVQRSHDDEMLGCTPLTVRSPSLKNGQQSDAIARDMKSVTTAMTRAKRPALRAPNQLIPPMRISERMQSGTMRLSATPKYLKASTEESAAVTM
jgi:hypothetical protein